jgi:hypothetical protein
MSEIGGAKAKYYSLIVTAGFSSCFAILDDFTLINTCFLLEAYPFN